MLIFQWCRRSVQREPPAPLIFNVGVADKIFPGALPASIFLKISAFIGIYWAMQKFVSDLLPNFSKLPITFFFNLNIMRQLILLLHSESLFDSILNDSFFLSILVFLSISLMFLIYKFFKKWQIGLIIKAQFQAKHFCLEP